MLLLSLSSREAIKENLSGAIPRCSLSTEPACCSTHPALTCGSTSITNTNTNPMTCRSISTGTSITSTSTSTHPMTRSMSSCVLTGTQCIPITWSTISAVTSVLLHCLVNDVPELMQSSINSILILLCTAFLSGDSYYTHLYAAYFLHWNITPSYNFEIFPAWQTHTSKTLIVTILGHIYLYT